MQNKMNPNFPVTGGTGARVSRDDLMERMRKAMMKQHSQTKAGRIRMPERRNPAGSPRAAGMAWRTFLGGK